MTKNEALLAVKAIRSDAELLELAIATEARTDVIRVRLELIDKNVAEMTRVIYAGLRWELKPGDLR